MRCCESKCCASNQSWIHWHDGSKVEELRGCVAPPNV
jgi:hypothetical protein